ncbi:hypothetical protein B0T26DRAFT_674320 [Lasiosphaeria miniovina]|uniref:Uncharacterized protein n=1 Tax=Lasiosphaeria miniovina TaxID=1954250 RepID=A0AA40AV77_9PEZI|nr:uncharacterized protein B0T26DRAFT_674320 [Lasiosphaeria miniovina]KAK0722638.1 hypothetical protein B0T26DRAFT_674320 [Lasiosphaeria miniovina]
MDDNQVQLVFDSLAQHRLEAVVRMMHDLRHKCDQNTRQSDPIVSLRQTSRLFQAISEHSAYGVDRTLDQATRTLLLQATHPDSIRWLTASQVELNGYIEDFRSFSSYIIGRSSFEDHLDDSTAVMYKCYDINPGVVLQSIERDFDETEAPARPTSPRAPSSDDNSSTHQASSEMLAGATQTPDTDDSSSSRNKSTNEDDAAPPLAKQRRRFAGRLKKSSLPPPPQPPRARSNRCRRQRRERCQHLLDEPRRNGSSSSSSGLGILSWPPCPICGVNMTFDEYTAELMYCKRCEGFQVHSG